MLRKVIVIFLLVVIQGLFSSVPEKYISITIQSPEDISSLTKLVSIDNRQDNTIYAYALPEQLERLQELGIIYELQTLPMDERATLTMATNIDEMSNWDRYPTYEVYLEMMNNFAIDYPELCTIQNIGYSQNNRQIPVVKITSNVNQESAKPGFYYSGQMHGDEVVSYILLLRLIDELLSNYGSDQEITDLVNTTEIWINPLANPDGTYYGGNNTVSNARRYLANNLDANRNFIDFIDGYPGTGASTSVSQENLDQISFMTGKGIVMSANTHSGQEVVNYAWDTIPGLHPDDAWFQQICRVYADAVHEDAPATYMDGFDDGITNGYDWYEANGTRQDYAIYYLGIKEITIEHSLVKLLDVSELNNHWNYNRDALLLLMEQVHYGIKGSISDYQGNPLEGTIEILNHDTEVTKVKSNADFGDYYRPINPGTYDVEISVEGYDSQIFTNVVVEANSSVIVNAVFGQAQIDQTLEFNNGWNLISYNLNYDNSAPQIIFSDVLDNIEEIKNLTASYSPSLPYYFNTLDSLSPQEAYWVRTNDACQLQLQAYAYVDQTAINLTSGWNLVGYLPQESLEPELALANISDYLLQVKDLTSIYNPSMPNAFNTMELMTPNRGYWIEVSQDCTLLYNNLVAKSTRQEIEYPWEIAIYPNNTAVIYAEFASQDLQIDFENDFIGAFSDNQCLGAGQMGIYTDSQGSARNVVAILVQMPSNEENISFVYYKGASGEEVPLNQQLMVEAGQEYGYLENNLVYLNYQPTNNYSDNLGQVNPIELRCNENPFNDLLSIQVKSKKDQELKLSLYNLKGQKVASKSLMVKKNRNREISFNTNDLACGIYFLKSDNCGKTSTLKLVKIK